MSLDTKAIIEACAAVIAGTADPRYNHTSHLHVRAHGDVLVDEHLRGPLVPEIFSVTKSVLATVLGVIAARGLLPPLDDPIAAVLPELRATVGAAHTWRHLLTMTRGAAIDGPWDIDEVTALPTGLVAHVADAPQRQPPGRGFSYDSAAPHLVSAAASTLVGEPICDYAQRELFQPLGIEGGEWSRDPDGVPFGYAHLRMSAHDLGRLAQLWLDGGRHGDRPLLDPAFLAQMTSEQTAGGPPEGVAYGFLTWVDAGNPMAAGWAGQHVLALRDASAVVVVTGDPRFEVGPPVRDELPPDWAPGLDLVRHHLLPALAQRGAVLR